MASKNKSYVQRTLDKLFSAYEGKLFDFKKVEMSKIENLRTKALNAIKGNESEYIEQVEDRINTIIEKIQLKEDKETAKLAKAAEENFGVEPTEVEVRASERVSASTETMKLSRTRKVGYAAGVITGIAVLGTTITLVSCGAHSNSENETAIVTEESSEVVSTATPAPTATPVEETVSEEELAMKKFVETTVEDTIKATNGMLSSGVELIDESLSEDVQKDLIAGLGLQYYVVANIDQITPAEYMNFMQAEHGSVIDNDDMISDFRNMNVLLYNQVLVSTDDNKIDFATLYKNELDAELLNKGAAIIVRYNKAETKKEKQQISKEFYEYVDIIFNDDFSKLKYSNSALATFINVEFKAWQELTENADFKFKKGAYPDDELVTRVLTTISKCGMSEGEEQELDVMDETKTSLESINVIRIAETLEDRVEEAKASEIELYNFASYGQMKEQVIKGIDLTLYNKLESYEDLRRKEILETKPVIHSNDSGVSNGQGGTIANSELTAHGIDPSSPTAKQDYEQSVRQETEKKFEQETVTRNEDGQEVDPNELAAWAEQGAIDANNGYYNSNVPDKYKDAYQSGWDAAMDAIRQAEANISSNTTFEPTTEEVVNQTEKIEEIGFVNDGITNNVPESTPAPIIPEVVIPETPSEVTDPNYSETVFVPVDTVVSETITSETVEGFAPVANASRTIEVNTITRDEKLQELYSLRNKLSNAALEAIQNANSVFAELEENNRTK